MVDLITSTLRSPARFLRRQDGTATVEAVLWFPIFLAIFGLMIDATMIFHGESDVLDVIQDANRNRSIGRFTTDDEVVAFINTMLAAESIKPKTVTAVTDPTTAIITTSVVVPMKQFQVFGWSSLLNLEVTVTAGHLLEDWTA